MDKITREEIKAEYSMRDILTKCGFPQPNRAGFIRCPFHRGDREPSMKIYEKDYYCFGCGASGDIFTFLQELYHVSFSEAFRMLGGSYGGKTFHRELAVYRAEKEQAMRKKEEARKREQRRMNYHLIDVYREALSRARPLSDAWCDCYNALQYQLYLCEILNEKRTGK